MKWTKWNIHKTDEDRVRELTAALPVSHLCARLLVSRGIDEPQAVSRFLQHDLGALHDPMRLEDMDRAVERIRQAIAGDERITVFGDYDVDGITSTYILSDYLASLGARCTFYIPDRIDEGYGVNLDAVDTLIDEGTTLIITVDTGITAHEAVMHAKTRGCDMILTDHHECRDTLPDAVAVINPHRHDSPYPFSSLAGVGVAFKLICALAGEVRTDYLPFVCIGTVADVMPLYDENRAIVYAGLRMLEKTEHVGLRALIEKAGISGRAFTADQIGFALAPRINAAGRMQHASQVVELFYETNAAQAEQRAQALCNLNTERQAQERKIFEEALALLPEVFDAERDAAIVLAGDGWHHGVIGIVASRLCNRFGCPVILLSKEGNVAKGSGRSIEGMNLYAALSGASEYLTQYGGHEMAVGLTIPCEHIPALRAHINACAQYELSDYIPCVNADFSVRAEELTVSEIEGLSVLEPFGCGNAPPLLCMQGARVESVTLIGKGRHLKFLLSQNNCRMEAVYFGKNGKDIDFTEGDCVDLLFRPEVNDFRGKNPQLLLRDIRPAQKEIEYISKALDLYNNVRGGMDCGMDITRCSPNYRELGMLWRAIAKLAERLPEGIPLVTLHRLCNGQIEYEKILVAFDVFCELGLLSFTQRSWCMEAEILTVKEKARLEDSKILRDIALRCNGMMI